MRRSGGQGAIVVAALMGLLGLIGVATVRGQTQPGTRVPMAEEVFKNIQVLKGIPEDQFMSTMGIFASSLGKNCSECHGEESGGNWARNSSVSSFIMLPPVLLGSEGSVRLGDKTVKLGYGWESPG